MNRVCLLLMTMIGIVLVGAVLSFGEELSGTAQNPQGYTISEQEAGLVARMNVLRARAKKPAFRVDARLMAAARGRAECTNIWSGDVHRPRGESFMVTISRAKYAPRSAAENCAWEFAQNPMSEAANSWMHSPGHKRNMMGNYRDVGVGWSRCKYRGQDGWVIYAIYGNE